MDLQGKMNTKKQIQRYLTGQCTPEESQLIESWFEKMSDPTLELSEEERVEIRLRMFKNIQKNMPLHETTKVVPLRSFSLWKVAASLLFFSALGYWAINSKSDFIKSVGTEFTSEVSDVIEIENVHSYIQDVKLPDGSTVSLQPKSKLSYTQSFNDTKREVTLIGEAFFDVSKDAQRPFYVYGSGVVTKVLGTSFWVIAPEDAKEVQIKVKTGKVSVYKQNPSTPSSTKSPSVNGVVLMPNQKVTYFVEDQHWVTSLVDAPLPITKIIAEDVHYKYDDATLQEIIKTLESDYGIEFILENEDAYACHFTGDISDIPLYDKLAILCKSIGLTYELKGTNILLNGKGCQ